MNSQLFEHYNALQSNATISELSLLNAANWLTYIPESSLILLTEQGAASQLQLSDEQHESEFGSILDEMKKSAWITTLVYCARVTLELKRSIGDEMVVYSGKPTQTDKSKAKISLEAKFRKLVSILDTGLSFNKKSKALNVKQADGSIKIVSREIRLIEVTTKLATKNQRVPLKNEVVMEIESLHPELKKEKIGRQFSKRLDYRIFPTPNHGAPPPKLSQAFCESEVRAAYKQRS